MQKLLIICCIISNAILLSGCSKEHEPFPAPPPVPTPQGAGPLLDSMVWSQLATTTYFAYRADSLQDKITTVSSYVSDTVRFTYNGRQLSHITNNRLNRSSDYFYNAAGKITLITMSDYGGNGHFRFAYGYDGAGRVNSLVYSLEQGTVTEKLYTATYQYDASGFLSAVNGLTEDGTIVTLTIDGYTEECNFNPWLFAGPVDPSEVLEIDNLPFLQTLKRLPAKITKTATNAKFIRQLTTTLQDHNLSRMVTARDFPLNPTLNYQAEVNLFYRH